MPNIEMTLYNFQRAFPLMGSAPQSGEEDKAAVMWLLPQGYRGTGLALTRDWTRT